MEQQSVKRGRGRPKGSKAKKKTFRDESGPLWAVVDQLTLIRDDIKEMTKIQKWIQEVLLSQGVRVAPVPPGALKGG
jgi:hypothetical protein